MTSIYPLCIPIQVGAYGEPAPAWYRLWALLASRREKLTSTRRDPDDGESKGLKLQGIDRHNSQRCQFIFQDRPDRPGLVNQFLCGSATGNVVDFVFYMRRAKRLLYSTEV